MKWLWSILLLCGCATDLKREVQMLRFENQRLRSGLNRALPGSSPAVYPSILEPPRLPNVPEIHTVYVFTNGTPMQAAPEWIAEHNGLLYAAPLDSVRRMRQRDESLRKMLKALDEYREHNPN